MLPSSIRVIVRDWLHANHIVLIGRQRAVLIDCGYGRDAAHTLSKVSETLAGRPLDWLVNTHCHSDPMGGNASVRTAHRFGGMASEYYCPDPIALHAWRRRARPWTPSHACRCV